MAAASAVANGRRAVGLRRWRIGRAAAESIDEEDEGEAKSVLTVSMASVSKSCIAEVM